MRRLILIKHSAPAFGPDAPPEQWRLSEEGRQRAEILANEIAALNPAALLSSDEPKAAETAKIVADRTGLAVSIVPGLHEHRRTNEPFSSIADRETAIKNSIRRPEELLYGSETTGDARRRFTAALETALPSAPPGDVAVVTHGTVASMFVARLTGLDPVEIWSRLGLPGFVVVGWPDANGIEGRWNYGEG